MPNLEDSNDAKVELDWWSGKAKAEELSPHPPIQQRLNHCGVQQTGAQDPGLTDGLRCFWPDEM